MRNGIRRFQIADPSNDPASLVRLARMVREEGAEEVVVGLTYSISPAHTHEYYVERASAIAGSPDIDRLYLKDPGGLLTPDAVRELVPAFIAAVAPRPVELHSHCTIGLGPLAYVEGLRAGIRTLHTAVAPVASGTSNPPAETTLRNLEAEGFSHGLDLEALAARVRALPRARARPRACRWARRPSTTPPTTATRCRAAWSRPRGGCSRRSGRPELFDAVLEEVTRVREEMGYPIMVTPVSQFVATQATMNVVSGERWRDVSDEMVRYFLGHFYEPAAPVDPQVADRVLSRRARPSCATSSRSAWRARASASARASRRRSCCCG